MTDITIMGDSWACGEWDLKQKLAHPGTEQYLRDAGHNVTSVAKGGACNREQTALMAESKADVIIWFLTDPLRDLTISGWSHLGPLTLESYHSRRDSLFKAAFDRMSDLPVWLIGGASAVPDWVASIYPKWRVIVPDLRMWLIPDAEPIDCLSRTWPYPDCSEDLLTYHEQQEKMLNRHFIRSENAVQSDEHRLFWPDGHHPNREAHLRLTNKLLLPLTA